MDFDEISLGGMGRGPRTNRLDFGGGSWSRTF